jgi:hypothetical protein
MLSFCYFFTFHIQNKLKKFYCRECLANPACGWCDEGSLTGLGRCHEGGARGPLLRKKAKVQSSIFKGAGSGSGFFFTAEVNEIYPSVGEIYPSVGEI